ncbi:MAG: phosphoribosylanthranilate isomerase [Euryarchaeota archaeon]|nr:phosphoribosylanthranilate isomerase [Euryarchaeota archaeon]
MRQVTRVKICGMRSAEDIGLAVRYGADAVGFITEVPVDTPRKLDIATAARLISQVPVFVDPVLVIMPGSGEQAVEMIEATQPSIVQIHNRLDATGLNIIRENTDVDIVRTFSIPRDREFMAEQLISQVGELVDDQLVDGVLLDTSTGSKVGGSGLTHDWAISEEIVKGVDVPVMVAGGLDPDNVGECVRRVRPYAVDTASGIETDGVKDETKIERFVKEVRCKI